MSQQQLAPHQAYFPKRVNEADKLGVIHLSTVKVVAIIMVFGIYLEFTNAALLSSCVIAYQMEKIQNKYGRGVIKHTLWRWGIWVTNEKASMPSPGINKLIK